MSLRAELIGLMGAVAAPVRRGRDSSARRRERKMHLRIESAEGQFRVPSGLRPSEDNVIRHEPD